VEEEFCALEAIFGEDCTINREERLAEVKGNAVDYVQVSVVR
jgi:hypothetical protein